MHAKGATGQEQDRKQRVLQPQHQAHLAKRVDLWLDIDMNLGDLVSESAELGRVIFNLSNERQ